MLPVDLDECMYKGKGDQYECTSFRGISVLSVVGKVLSKVLIKKI